MKTILISNTLFGYKNNNLEWLKIMANYFNHSFIPYLKNNDIDQVIHAGNLFVNTNLNIQTLNLVQDLFTKITQHCNLKLMVGHKDRIRKNSINAFNIFKGLTNIEIITQPQQEGLISYLPYSKNIATQITEYENQYLVLNNQIEVSEQTIFNGYFLQHQIKDQQYFIGAPYSLNYNHQGGFLVLDSKTNKIEYVLNEYSPQYVILSLRTEQDLDNLDPVFLGQNFVKLEIDKKLWENLGTKLRVVLSQYPIEEVTYQEEEKPKLLPDTEELHLEEMVRKHITQNNNPNLITEFEHILNLYHRKIS